MRSLDMPAATLSSRNLLVLMLGVDVDALNDIRRRLLMRQRAGATGDPWLGRFDAAVRAGIVASCADAPSQHEASAILLRAYDDPSRTVVLTLSSPSSLSFWRKHAAREGVDAVAIVAIQALSARGTADVLPWLANTLAVERASRRIPRRLVRPDDAASTTGDREPASEPTRHDGWVRHCDAAITRLIQRENEQDHRALDDIANNLDAALALFTPIAHKSRVEVAQLRVRETQLRTTLRKRDVARRSVARELAAMTTQAAEAAELQERVRAAVTADEQTRSTLLDLRFRRGRDLARSQHTETQLVARAERMIKAARTPIAQWLQKRGWAHKMAAQLMRQIAIIETFLDALPWEAVGVHPGGRRRRILAYLTGATNVLADFPLLRDQEYVEMYPDVGSSGMPPLVHFIRYGQPEGRNPHPLFDTDYYRRQCPEAVHLASSAVVHYFKWGARKGHDPHPLFSTRNYLARYPDVARAGRNPLIHWVEHVLVTADPRFDHEFYLTAYPDVADAGRDPLAHYLLAGWQEGRNPNPWFDTQRYLADHPRCARDGINPLVDYVLRGGNEMPPASAAAYMNHRDMVRDGSLRRLSEEQASARHRSAPGAVRSPTTDAKSGAPVPRIALVIGDTYPAVDHDTASSGRPDIVPLLQRLNYEVHYLALLAFDDPHARDAGRSRAALESAGVRCVTREQYPFVEGYYFARSEQIDVCVVSQTHFDAQQQESLRRLCRDVKIVFEASGRLPLDKGDARAAITSADCDATGANLAATADATIVASAHEKEQLERRCPQAKSVLIWPARTGKNEVRSFRALLDQIGVAPPKTSH